MSRMYRHVEYIAAFVMVGTTQMHLHPVASFAPATVGCVHSVRLFLLLRLDLCRRWCVGMKRTGAMHTRQTSDAAAVQQPPPLVPSVSVSAFSSALFSSSIDFLHPTASNMTRFFFLTQLHSRRLDPPDAGARAASATALMSNHDNKRGDSAHTAKSNLAPCVTTAAAAAAAAPN